jgi:phthiodiolone/phenolphthiodiolone dimycocerosates ketoreductase
VIEQAAEWRDCGVRHLVASNISFLQPRLRNGLASTVPFFRIMRRLRKL